MPLARSTLVAGDTKLVLPINPYSAQWTYQHNVSSTDTLGGRVVQLLSVQLTDLVITSVAGGRRQLQEVAINIREIMNYHVHTSLPAKFVVPSRAWRFGVYVRAMPSMGWDVGSTTYPYQLSMAIVDDLEGIKTRQVTRAALSRLAEGIGYDPAVHGGNTAAFTDLVDTVLKMAPELVPSAGSGGGAGTDSQWGGRDLWQPDISNAPWNGRTIRDQIYGCWRAAFGARAAEDALCIAERESGFGPRAHNSYVSSGVHHVYGLFQISDVHSAQPWWPAGVHGLEGGLMYDAEYNTRSAMMIYKQQGWSPWSTASGCGL